MANQVSFGGYLESSLSNSYVFTDCLLNDIVLYTDYPKQNLLFGTDHEKMSALCITSNTVKFNHNIYTQNTIGLGTSNVLHMSPSHRFTIMGPSNNSNSPSFAMYTADDTNYPVYQQWVNHHDSILFGLDAFYTGSNILSSSSNFNVLISKSNHIFSLLIACNVIPGVELDSKLTPEFSLSSNGLFSFGNIDPVQKITVKGSSNSVDGPHFITYTDQDIYPLTHSANLSHDFIVYGIDAYIDANTNSWFSSDSNANYQISKSNGKLIVFAASNIEPGANVLEEYWNPSIMVNSNAFIGIGGLESTHRLTVRGPDMNAIGPHMAFYTSFNPNHATMQFLNWTSDHISISFDTYWNLDSNMWISSDSNANFRIQKENATLTLYSASNIPQGLDIAPEAWVSALSIGSNSFVALGNSNPTYRLTVVGPSNDVSGPHTAFYVTQDSNYPVFQQYNTGHDDVSLAFDSYYDGNDWLSSDSRANFKISKHQSKLTISAGSPVNPGDPVTWSPSITVSSNAHISVQGTTLFHSNVNFSAHAIPTSNMVWDLGSSNKRWRDLYLSGDSINLQNVLLKKEPSSAGLVVVNGESNTVTRIWAKELLIGNPDDVTNNNTYLLFASNNGLQIKNMTSNIIPQFFSQVKNLFITDSNIGIGLSNPTTIIHSRINVNNQIKFDTSVNGQGILIGIEDCNLGGGALLWNLSNAHIKFGTGNIERMRVSRDGKVYIGAVDSLNSLNSILEISAGGSNNSFMLYNNSNSKYGIWMSTSNYYAQIGAQDWTNNNNLNLIIQPNACNVGIGTLVPREKLHILGKTYVSEQILGNSSNGSNVPVFSFYGDSNSGIYNASPGTIGIVTNSIERMNIDSNGKLEVAGDVVIRSNISMYGNCFACNLSVRTNIITINSDQTLWSGLEIVRGSLSNQFIIFQESTGLIKIGVSNNIQAICTRDDIMIDGYAYFDSFLKKIKNRNITIADVSNLQTSLDSYLPLTGGSISGSLQVNSNIKSTSTGVIGIPYLLYGGYFDLTDTVETIGFTEPGNPGSSGSMFHLGFLNGSNCSGDFMSWTKARLVIRGCSLNTSNSTNTNINICCYNSNTGSNLVVATMTCRDFGTTNGYTTNISPYFTLSNNVAPYLGIQLVSSNVTYRVGPTNIIFSAD